MKKIIFLIVLFFVSFISFGQVYQEMPQYGYRANRMAFDSSLIIPTTCGVPTLRTNITKKAAIAFDSCNNRFYQYNPKTSSWSIIGGGSDTTSLSNRINLKLNISDTSAMMSNYATDAQVNVKIDSLKRSSDSVYAYKNSQWVFQYKDSTGGGGGTPSLQQVTDIGNSTSNNIAIGNSLQIIQQFSPFNVAQIGTDNLTDSRNLQLPDNSGTFALDVDLLTKLNISDTATMLSNYATDNQVNQKLNITDTANKWVNLIYRISGKDSIFYRIGSTTYAIKDSIGTGGGQNGRFGNDTATIVMAKVHNDAGVTLTNGKVVAFSTSGTSSDAPSVKLANNKADSTSATTFGFVSETIAVNDTGWVILSGKIEKLNTSAYANGDIIYLDSISGQWTKSKPQAPYHLVYLGTVVKANAGNGSIYAKVQNGYEISELHDVKITSPINNQVLAYSDTQQLWKNRNIYSIVDTTTTVATKSNVALKLNISDTASMLNPYLLKIDTTNKFVNTITRTVGKDSIIFYIGGTRYAIKDSTGGGGGSAAGSTGYVQFNTSGAFAADSSLFWDNTNKRLGIGTTTPARTFVVVDDNKGTRGIQNDSYGNFSALLQYRRANGTLSSPTQVLANDDLGFFGASGYHSGGSFASTSSASIQFSATENYTSTALGARIIFGTTPNGSITRSERLRIDNDGNVLIGTTTNAGYKFDVNGTARVQGALNFNPTNTAAGTTGNQTINKTSGTVNIAAAGTTVTVTNSLVTANSIVFAVIRTNDATATIKNVVPAAGSFTINLNAAATAETSIGFFVIN